jgi:glucokinase
MTESERKPGESLYLGVDCGGTSLRVAAADSSGRIVAEAQAPTLDASERENGLGEAILAAVRGLASSLPGGSSALRGIGVGLPFVCHDGRIWLNRNVRALDPGALEASLSSSFGAPVALLNDVKCAALGESWLGAARGAENFIFVNVGTGLAAAVFAEGRLLMGAHGAAGEIGYWLTGADDAEALDAGLGPLEEAASGVGIASSYAKTPGEEGEKRRPSAEALSAEEVFRRAREGEPKARVVVERGLAYLLPALANLATLADPELLVLGGGVSQSLREYEGLIIDLVGRATPFPPRVAFSSLGKRAGLVGALRLGIMAASGSMR